MTNTERCPNTGVIIVPAPTKRNPDYTYPKCVDCGRLGSILPSTGRQRAHYRKI